MGDSVWYRDRCLGSIKLNDNDTQKFVFIAEDLDSLTTFFRLKPEDEIDIEGRTMKYGEFRRKELPTITAFYPTLENWLLKNERVRNIEEYEQQQSSRG